MSFFEERLSFFESLFFVVDYCKLWGLKYSMSIGLFQLIRVHPLWVHISEYRTPGHN